MKVPLAAPPPPDYAIGMMNDLRGSTLGDYTLLERTGKGGMSEVWKAESASGAIVAIKLLRVDPDQDDSAIFLARFEREARIIADLNHPHILPMLDYGQDQAFVYLVMRYISGGTLADVIRSGKIAPSAANRYIKQLASALDHAHKLQVIHRDLKPSNVLLDDAGNAYLTDFGIARFANMVGDLTETGNVMGTPAYMAPEQWRAEMLDSRTDVYGLGIMTYLMLTCHTPFEADHPHNMMYQHLDQAPPPLHDYVPDLPLSIQQVIFKAIAKQPNDRYPSAGAFAADFENAMQGKPIVADTQYHLSSYPAQPAIPLPPPPMPRTPRYPIPPQLTPRRLPSSRWLWLAMGGGILVLMGLSFALMLFFWNTVIDGEVANGTPAGNPTATLIVTPDNRPLHVPRVQLQQPTSREIEVEVGQAVAIRVMAYYRDGVTRVELRREGETLQQVFASGEGGQPQFAAAFTYTPASAGLHRLEIIAFREGLAGDPTYLTLHVEEAD